MTGPGAQAWRIKLQETRVDLHGSEVEVDVADQELQV